MRNVIKSQLFGLKKDTLFLAGTILFLCLPMVYLLSGEALEESGAVAWVNMGNMGSMLMGFMVCFMLPLVVGRDFADKTINYEVLFGHSKREIYFSRVLVALLYGFFMFVAGLGLPILIVILKNGFGPNVVFQDLLAKWAVGLCIFFRMMAENIFFSFLLMNAQTCIMFSVIMLETMAGTVMVLAAFTPYKWLVGANGMLSLINCLEAPNQKLGFVDGKDVVLYEVKVFDSFFCWNTVGSVAIGIVCIMAGYILFHKRDLR